MATLSLSVFLVAPTAVLANEKWKEGKITEISAQDRKITYDCWTGSRWTATVLQGAKIKRNRANVSFEELQVNDTIRVVPAAGTKGRDEDGFRTWDVTEVEATGN
jgi:hypothetical protein